MYDVLIVDDDAKQLARLKGWLSGYKGPQVVGDQLNIQISTDAQAVIDQLVQAPNKFPFRVIVADVFMPQRGETDVSVDHGGLAIYEALKQVRAQPAYRKLDIRLALISAFGDVAYEEVGVVQREQREWIEQHEGASPWAVYIPKPGQLDDKRDGNARTMKLGNWIRAIIETIKSAYEDEWLAWRFKGTLEEYRGISQSFEQVRLQVRSLANNYLVAITGESGTGKEMVARALHETAGRKGKFVVLNCETSPELVESSLFGHEAGIFPGATKKYGLVWEADEQQEGVGGGTLFLDEFGGGERFEQLEPMLRRFLDPNLREYRPIGADSQVFKGHVILGGSRLHPFLDPSNSGFADLKRRVGASRIEAPPLRDHPGDLEVLVEYFLRKASRLADRPLLPLSDLAMAALRAYHWPGNAGELWEVVQAAVDDAWSHEILLEDLSPHVMNVPKPPAAGATDPSVERVRDLLVFCGGNKKQVGQILWPQAKPESSRRRLNRFIEKHRELHELGRDKK